MFPKLQAKYILSNTSEFYLRFCGNLVGKLFKLLTPQHLGHTGTNFEKIYSTYHTTMSFSLLGSGLSRLWNAFYTEDQTYSLNVKKTVGLCVQLYQSSLILSILQHNFHRGGNVFSSLWFSKVFSNFQKFFENGYRVHAIFSPFFFWYGKLNIVFQSDPVLYAWWSTRNRFVAINRCDLSKCWIMSVC